MIVTLQCSNEHFSNNVANSLPLDGVKRKGAIHTLFVRISYILPSRQNMLCFGDFLPMRTRCDAYHKEFVSH